ncbi:hypothetical protein C4D60_Mb06t32000 [Musa balbisiana]|uniref:ubiquitinyl hydrolase 1 n=1 Tax=Musa balbisiana TaxID=52838 RepID=A0A4S8IS61_MUSBA|nr:hypothetical protein C4D60_Mb06t32000 [Musa balbisiana]
MFWSYVKSGVKAFLQLVSCPTTTHIEKCETTAPACWSPPVSSSPHPSPLRLLFFISCRSGSDRRPRRRSGGISEEDEKGLKSLGNSCYLNSALHFVTDTPPLAQFYLSSRHLSLCKSSFENREECAFCILERQIARSLSLDGPLDLPSKIHKCLADFAEHFQWRRQEDAHEFLRYVIGSCHTACLKTHKRSISGGNPKAEERSWSSTVMKEIFGGWGALLSQAKCLTCKDALEQDRRDSSRMPSLDSFSLEYSNRKKLSVARTQMFIHEHPMCLSYSPRDLKARMVQKLTGESNLMEFLSYQSSCVI